MGERWKLKLNTVPAEYIEVNGKWNVDKEQQLYFFTDESNDTILVIDRENVLWAKRTRKSSEEEKETN